MPSFRPRRVADLIRSVVSDLIARELEDPRFRTVHITDVQVSPDLRQATLYFSLYAGGTPERQVAAAALNRASGFLRREIAHRVRLRVAPSLHFVADDTMEYAAHIEQVLAEIREESAATAIPPAADEEE